MCRWPELALQGLRVLPAEEKEAAPGLQAAEAHASKRNAVLRIARKIVYALRGSQGSWQADGGKEKAASTSVPVLTAAKCDPLTASSLSATVAGAEAAAEAEAEAGAALERHRR